MSGEYDGAPPGETEAERSGLTGASVEHAQSAPRATGAAAAAGSGLRRAGAGYGGADLLVVARDPSGFPATDDPDGGRSFGLWQPGQIQAIAVLVPGQQTPTYLYVFQTTFAAWSPDGRYFVDQLSMSGLLLPAGRPAPGWAVLRAAQVDQLGTLPIRDTALQQALAHDVPLPARLGPLPPGDLAPLAWRPDGKALAILNQDNGFTVREAATGRVVMAINLIERPPSSLPPPGAFGTSMNLLLWSPDGTWLLPSLGLVHVGQLSV